MDHMQGRSFISVRGCIWGLKRKLQMKESPEGDVCPWLRSCVLESLMHTQGNMDRWHPALLRNCIHSSRQGKGCRPACVRPDVEAISNSCAPFLGASCRIRSSPTDEGSKTCREHVIKL